MVTIENLWYNFLTLILTVLTILIYLIFLSKQQSKTPFYYKKIIWVFYFFCTYKKVKAFKLKESLTFVEENNKIRSIGRKKMMFSSTLFLFTE